MNAEPIGAQPIAYAGLRRLASEQGGPRPDGVRPSESTRAAASRTAQATRP